MVAQEERNRARVRGAKARREMLRERGAFSFLCGVWEGH